MTTLIPIKEAATLINRSHRTACELCRAGRLGYRKDAAGRYWCSTEDVDRFLGPTHRPRAESQDDGMERFAKALGI